MEHDTVAATFNIEQAAKYLGVSVNSVRRLTRDSEIPHARYLGKLHYRRDDLDSYIDSHTYEAA